MKKWIVLIIVLICLVPLLIYGRSYQKSIATKIDESVTHIDVEYTRGSDKIKWSLDENEIVLLREWLDGLKRTHVLQIPGVPLSPQNGGATYTFTLTGGDLQEFSYIDEGQECFLVCDGRVFSVSNPSELPISVPEA